MPATALSNKVSGLKFMQRAAAAKVHQQQPQRPGDRSDTHTASFSSAANTKQAEPSAGASSATQQLQAGDAGGEEWTLPDSVTGRNHIPVQEDGIIFDPYWRDWTAPAASSSSSDPSSSSGLRKSFAHGAVKQPSSARKAPAEDESQEDDGDSSRGAGSSAKSSQGGNKRKAPQSISSSSSNGRGFMKTGKGGSGARSAGGGGPSKKKARKS